MVEKWKGHEVPALKSREMTIFVDFRFVCGIMLDVNLYDLQSKGNASGLVVKSIVAIDGPRVRFSAGIMTFGLSLFITR